VVNAPSISRFKSPVLSRRCFQKIRSILRGPKEAAMPFLFFMVFPLAVWDTLVSPPARQPAAREGTRHESSRESSREHSSEPWGRLTP
jgi:hypothetical protein